MSLFAVPAKRHFSSKPLIHSHSCSRASEEKKYSSISHERSRLENIPNITFQDILCNNSALKCTIMTHFMLYVLFNCVLTSSEMFPAIFKHRWILILFKGLMHFIWLHVFIASGETSGDLSENVTKTWHEWKFNTYCPSHMERSLISNGGSLLLRTAAPMMIPCYFTFAVNKVQLALTCSNKSEKKPSCNAIYINTSEVIFLHSHSE